MLKRVELVMEHVGKAAAMIVLLLALLIVYDAFNRYLFHSGSIALQELEWHLFDLVMLFGVVYALKHDAHVRVDIFYDTFSLRTKRTINLVGHLLLILPFSLFVVYFSSDFVMLSFAQGECSSDPGGLCYRYLIKGVMVAAFMLLALQSLLMALKEIAALKDAA